MSKDIDNRLRDVTGKARRQGWRVNLTGSGHVAFYAPNGKDIIVTASTSRSVRGFRNFMSRMRRAGFEE